VNKEEEFKQYLDRLSYFTDEISGWNRALLAAQGGMPFGEALEEEMFIEEKIRRNRSYHALVTLTEHLLLLKMKYYTKDRKHGNWGNTIRTSRLRAASDTGWDMREPDTMLIDYLSGAIQEIYEAGVRRYQKESVFYPNRKDRTQTVPEHCPWSLEELINGTVDELLEKLPDKEADQ